jgi:putative inorganic carbon (HCO3(-)) transporter
MLSNLEGVSEGAGGSILSIRGREAWLDTLILFGILVTLFFMPLHEKMKAGAFLFTLIFWFIKLARKRDRPRIWIPPLGWALLLFVGVAFLSAVFSDFHNRATRGALDAFRYTLFFLILVDTLDSYAKIKLLCAVLMAAIVVGDIAAIYHYFYVNHVVMMLSIGDKNSTAQVLSYVLSLFFGLFFGLRKDYLFRGFLLGVIGLTGFVLALTIARGIWLAVVAEIVIFWAVQRDWKIPAALTILAVGVLVGMSFSGMFSRRVASLEHPITDESMVERYQIWRQALGVAEQRPILGIGLRTYGYPAMKEKYHLTEATHAHNLFINVAAEVGLVGLASLILWLWIYAKSLHRMYPDMKSAEARALWLGGLGCFVALMVGGIVHPMIGAESSVTLMTVLGLMFAGFRIEAQSRRPPTSESSE